MPSRIWNEELKKWVWVEEQDSKLAINTEVFDVAGHYHNTETEGEEVLNVEECLEQIGEKLNSGDIGAIGEIRDKVDELDGRVTYIEENGGGGGGGGGSIMPKVELLSEDNFVMPTDGEQIIYYNFSSPNIGFGTVYISVDFETVEELTISQGRNSYTIKNLPKGTHTLDIYVSDITGLFSNTVTITVTVGGLELTSKFDSSNDITLEDYIRIKYYIDTISTEVVNVRITIDDEVTDIEGNIGENVLDIGRFTSLGVHTVTIHATSGNLDSNTLTFVLVVADSDNLYLSTMFPAESTIAVGKNLQIDYRNSMLNETRFTTHMFMNGEEIDVVTSYLGYNYWNIGNNLDIGEYTFSMYSTTTDGTHTSNTLTWKVSVIAEDYVPFKIVTDGLLCNFDANGQQQTSSTKNIWKDTSGNGVHCELFNFNYSTNGWIDNSLVFNGKTYAKVDFSPLADNIPDGLTIDILFKVKNVGDINGKVLWYRNNMTPYQGCYINTYEANISSANSRRINCQFQDDTWTRVTWVIDRENQIMLCYVNAIITRCIYLTSTENFKLNKAIYLGASLDETENNLDDAGNPIPHHASCSIKNLRIYNRPLTDEEVLQNHIADIKDKEEQLAIRDKNYGDSTMPVMKFEGNVDGMTGDIYKLVTIDYNDPLDPSKRFRKEQCKVKWQGTSSLEYPVKNYTIELRSGGDVWEYAPKDNWIPEKRYTLKASFMDSSTYNNVGTSEMMYDYFRASNLFYPQEIKNNKTRAVIDGFPIRLYINGECKGIYMFNIDRYAEKNYGFEGEQSVVSYEIAVNSEGGAGAFATDAWESIRSEFEMRYHYGGDESVVCETITVGGVPTTVLKAGYHSELQNLVSWVCNSSIEEFRSELREHFELNFLIDYYLWVFCLGLVDNLGKNMVLTTFGMNGEGNVIWYPSFYDCDSELGLTNDGELRYGSGIDVATDNFNTSDSLLWTKLNEAFPDEIQDRYIYMRSNGFMTYENIIGYYERIADTIGQTFYNEDARIKYINEDNKGFIYMCNGSRLEHTKRWVTERIKYMDSCFNYGDWLLSSTIRSNITGEVSLYVKTYSPQWVEISFSDSATGTVRKWCDKDKFYEFTNEIENAVDNNITIRGVTNVMYLQGLEGLNVSSMLISNATGLCEIDIHGSKRIQRLELGSNVMLQKLNCKDCSFLGYDDNYKVIDVSKCVNLKYIDLSGTKVGTLQLNENGGALEYLNLAESEITYLVCNYQEYLPAITLDGCANLSTVQVTQCNALTTITLPGSKIEDFRVTDCKKLDYINISNTSYLKTLDLTGCTGLRHLNMSGISSKSLTELDARSLSNLKILDISKCYYLRNIRFAKGFNTIQSINFKESGIETIQYGNDSVAEYLDLTPFSLSYIDFYHCSSLKRIKGLNVVSSSSPQMFNGCTSLERIDGYMKIKGNMNWTFAGCSKLSVFPTMDLSEVTWCHRTFDGCSKMTYNQMMTFLDSVPNCTGFNGTFWNCSGISYSGWKKALFDKMSKATELNEPFAGTNIRGQLESGLFDSLTELKTTYRLFAWNKVTGSIPANLFKYNTKLTSVQEMFRDNPNLSSATNITSMFQTTTELSNIYGLFWGCGNALIRLDDKIFANCPNLTNMSRVFQGCSNLTGNISQHPNLVKGRSKLTSAEYTLHDCRGLTGDLPPDYFAGCTSLTNINGHFENCSGITGELKTTIWANCPKLVHASALFAGCSGLGGYTGKTQEIPKDFFKGKNKLENISRMFSGCTSLQFKLIPEWDDEYDEDGALIRKGDSSWFKDCTNLTNVSGLFSGCTNLYSSLPNRFFEILDAEGNSVDTKIVYASSVFSLCDGLLNEIPPDLFKHLVRVTDLGGFFYHCNGLSGGVPRTLFENCYELSSIAGMFEYSSVSRYSYELTPESPYFIDEDVFWNCTKLSNISEAFAHSAFKGEIPPLLFRTSIRLNNAYHAFGNSGGFTGSLDSQLFSKCSVLENVESTFSGCGGLNGELSSNIFTKKNNPRITNFKYTFSGCSNLEGYAPQLWIQYPGIDGEGCFAGCNKLGNIADVPTQWK